MDDVLCLRYFPITLVLVGNRSYNFFSVCGKYITREHNYEQFSSCDMTPAVSYCLSVQYNN